MNTDTDEFKLFSKSKAAMLMGIGVDKLNKLINEGRIGVIQLDNRLMIPKQQIQLFLDNNTIHFTNSHNDVKNYDVDDLRNRLTKKYSPKNLEKYNPMEKFTKAKQEKLNV